MIASLMAVTALAETVVLPALVKMIAIAVVSICSKYVLLSVVLNLVQCECSVNVNK